MKNYFYCLLSSTVMLFTTSNGYTMDQTGDKQETRPQKRGLVPPTRQAPPPLQHNILELGVPYVDETGRIYFKKDDPPRSPPATVKN